MGEWVPDVVPILVDLGEFIEAAAGRREGLDDEGRARLLDEVRSNWDPYLFEEAFAAIADAALDVGQRDLAEADEVGEPEEEG